MTYAPPTQPLVRVLLISRPGQAREIYARALQRAGAEVDVAGSIEDLHEAVTHQPYHGVVVDIPTKIQALRDHKELVSSILGSFPVIQVNVDPATGRIRALRYGCDRKNDRLEDFIRRECRRAVPRLFRRRPRSSICCQVRLRAVRCSSGAPGERTVSVNLSEGGCFLFTAKAYAVGDKVSMLFREIDPRRPLMGVVRHRIPWGERSVMPGIGVEFSDLDDYQRQILKDLLHAKGPGDSPGDLRP
jgi:Tfp pilus assembly protein PilZ